MKSKAFLGVFLILAILLVMQINTISAANWDNIKEFKDNGRYGTIEVYNSFIIPGVWKGDKLAEYELTDHSYSVLTGYSKIEAELFEDGVLLEKMKAYDKNNKDLFGDLKKFDIVVKRKVYVDYDVDDYELQCEDIFNSINGTTSEVCEDVVIGNHEETKEEWEVVNYKLGQKEKAGEYTIEFFGEREGLESGSIDWVFETMGIKTTEWAEWWDNDWEMKREINISGVVPFEAPVLVLVENYSDSNGDYSDFRFVDLTDTTEFSYYLESYNATIGRFHVRVPDNSSFYVYYANSVVSSISSFDAVLYDDFEDGVLDTNKSIFVRGACTGTAWSESNGEANASCLNDNNYAVAYQTENSSFLTWDDAYVDYTLSMVQNYDVNRFNRIGFKLADSTGVYDVGWDGYIGTLGTGSSFSDKIWNWTDDDAQVTIYQDSSDVGNLNDKDSSYTPTVQITSGSNFVAHLRIFNVNAYNYLTATTEIGAQQNVSGLISSFVSPADNFESTDETVDLKCTFTGNLVTNTNVLNVTIKVYDSDTNLVYTDTDLTPAGLVRIYNKTWTTPALSDGIGYNWSCNGWGSDDSFDETINRTFSIDTVKPIINISAPSGDQGSFIIGNNLSLNWNVSDSNLGSCWFDYNNINTSVTCADNNYSFITVVDKQSLIFYANDTSGNLGSNSTSWTYSFLENNITFNTEVFETSHQNFVLNLTTDETILSVNGDLNYDGSNYLSTIVCNSGNCLLSNNIDIPIVNSGLSDSNEFFWNFTIFNGTASTNIKTSTNNQTVNKTYLELCNATHTIETQNFTAYDEINLSKLSNFKFDSRFDFWIGNGGVKRNSTFSTNGNEINLCMRNNLNYSVISKTDYDEYGNTTTYTSRFYYQQNHSINDVSEKIPLYLLQSAFSTSFILKVQDQNLLPVTDALIEIQRCYAGEDGCRTVQVAKTDENGKSIGFFQTETVDYKFIIVKNGETLLETGTQKVIPETSPYTLTFNIGDDLGSPWKGIEDIVSLDSTLVFNKDTNIVTYSYIDTSTNFTSANLTVTKNSLSNSSATSIICSEVSTLSSSTITCDVGNTTGFYTASGYITRSGTALDKQISFQIEDVSSIVGLLGLFYGFFFVLVLVFMFKFNEIAGIWLMVIGIILLNITGLIKFGMVFVTAIIVLAIIITWLLEK